MGTAVNRQVRLKLRPTGIPDASHFEIADAAEPALADRQFLVRNEYLLVEPAMRGWVSAIANYSEPVPIGGVMRAFAAGTVVASRHPGYAEGERVMGMLGWQEYAVADVLGLNGTAYFGLLDLGQPKPGDTVVVSTAAGAVGSAGKRLIRLCAG